MEKMIGLDTYLYTFKLKDINKYKDKMEKLQKLGIITEIFINNGLGFEFKKNMQV